MDTQGPNHPDPGSLMDKKNLTGRVFQRIYRDRKGNLQKTSTWFLKYRIGDKPVTIPTGTQDYQEAVAILQQKINRAAQLCHFDEPKRVLVNQLLDLLIDDYQSKDRYTTYDVEHRVARHLRPFFGAKEPTEITAALLEHYVTSRADRAAPATVNKELAFLKRALRLGYRHEPQFVCQVPTIPMLPIHKNVNGSAAPSEHRNHGRLLESDTVQDKNEKPP
jgi:hypothetical protein